MIPRIDAMIWIQLQKLLKKAWGEESAAWVESQVHSGEFNYLVGKEFKHNAEQREAIMKCAAISSNNSKRDKIWSIVI